jgi:hypothetical protein
MRSSVRRFADPATPQDDPGETVRGQAASTKDRSTFRDAETAISGDVRQ